jgi:hypothetical protein
MSEEAARLLANAAAHLLWGWLLECTTETSLVVRTRANHVFQHIYHDNQHALVVSRLLTLHGSPRYRNLEGALISWLV